MKIVKKYKYVFIVGTIFFILFVLAFIALKNLLYPDSDRDIYGDRLSGISEHQVKDDSINKIKASILESSKVNTVTYRLEGRWMIFNIDVKSGTDVITAKAFGDIILGNLDEDIKSYYDIQLSITEKENKENDLFPIIGYKHKTKLGFVW